jgi:uncharacterized Zn finger protein
MNKLAFCAKEQIEVEHDLSIEGAANDVTLTCSSCGHFIKVPQGITKKELDSFLSEHKEANIRDLDLQIPILTEEEKSVALENLI